MRIVILTATLLSLCFGAPGADVRGADNNPIKVTHVIKDGTLRISLKNISNRPISAYVVGVEDGGQTNTHHDFYTGRRVFGPGKTIELMFVVQSVSSTPKVFVDYVRLSDNSIWGNPVTDDGKDVAASF